jgi:transcriptional regulator with GAF, ATPase, and Fis domain
MAYFTLKKPHGKDERILIEKKITTIGRLKKNDIWLEDKAVSGFHAHLFLQGDHYILTDLKSKNGTYLNGKKITSTLLNHQDEISIGPFKLVFSLFSPRLEEEIEELASLPSPSQVPSSIWQKLKNSVQKLEVEVNKEKRSKNNFKTLVEVARILNSYHQLEEVLKATIDLAIKVLSAERGFIMLKDKKNSLQVKISRKIEDEEIKDSPSSSVSFSLIRKVEASKKPVLVSDTLADDEFRSRLSIIQSQIKSILCTPLLDKQNELLGVLYLDTSIASGLFSREDLDLIVGFSNLAALAIENSYLIAKEKTTAQALARLEEKQKYLEKLNQLEEEKKELLEKIENYQFEELIGSSPGMQKVFKIIDQVAKTDVPVLIEGETGTGKELVARAIHKRSLRASYPLVVVNCGAIPADLLEAELFGHEKGAFTGAYTTRRGKFELADGGTVFLDEIGELNPALQVKLLRVLQEQEIERIGGNQTIKINTRIITATHQNLKKMVEKNVFREDLFYRIKVVSITLPSLKERKEDILLLANYFLTSSSQKLGKTIKGFTPEAKEVLLNYSWPGNIRELENKIKRAVVMSETDYLTPGDLELIPSPAPPRDLKKMKEEIEVKMIRVALAKHHGNITHTAAELKMSRRNLRLLMQKYQLDKKNFF